MSCPICAKAVDPAYRPFCSRRCADIDLGRWLRGSYVIPTDETEVDETPGAGRDDDGPMRPS